MFVHTYRPMILKENGLSMEYFADQEEALKVADELIEQSASEFEFTKSVIPHENPLLSKHLYMIHKGLKKSYTQTERKKLDMEMDMGNKCGKKMLEGIAVQDLVGVSSGSSSENVKLEFPHYTKLQAAVEKLR